jgi:hypothetical protein
MTRTFETSLIRFSRLWMVAALLAALLLTWTGTTVRAGAAFIKAAQNPITTFGGPGSTTISWDTGNGQNAEIWGGFDNQGAVNGPYPAPPTGSFDSGPIAAGHSASYYLYTVGKGQLLAPVLTVTVKILLVDPCVIGQCIKNVVTAPGGTFVKITFTTSQATVPALTVSKAGPGCVATATDVHSTLPLLAGAQTMHTLGVAGLIAERTYHYLITAGNAQKTGCFTTLMRLVTVNFAEITVVDDSDGGFDGAGDLTFSFTAAGVSGTKYGQVSVASGSPPVHPNRTIVVTNAPASLSLAVAGWDEDCGGPFVSTCYQPFCVEGSCPDHGSDGSYDWATAADTYNVAVKPNAKDGFDENFTAPFTLSTLKYELQFKVTGTYKVEYK